MRNQNATHKRTHASHQPDAPISWLCCCGKHVTVAPLQLLLANDDGLDLTQCLEVNPDLFFGCSVGQVGYVQASGDSQVQNVCLRVSLSSKQPARQPLLIHMAGQEPRAIFHICRTVFDPDIKRQSALIVSAVQVLLACPRNILFVPEPAP